MFKHLISVLMWSFTTGLYLWIVAIFNGLKPIEPSFINLVMLGFSFLALIFLAVVIFYLAKINLGYVTQENPEWVRYINLYKTHPKNQIPLDIHLALEKFNA